MQNLKALSRVAMFQAERVTGTGASRTQPQTTIPCGDPDRLAVRGPLRCRWRATGDGTLRMEWQRTSI